MVRFSMKLDYSDGNSNHGHLESLSPFKDGHNSEESSYDDQEKPDQSNVTSQPLHKKPSTGLTEIEKENLGLRLENEMLKKRISQRDDREYANWMAGHERVKGFMKIEEDRAKLQNDIVRDQDEMHGKKIKRLEKKITMLEREISQMDDAREKWMPQYGKLQGMLDSVRKENEDLRKQLKEQTVQKCCHPQMSSSISRNDEKRNDAQCSVQPQDDQRQVHGTLQQPKGNNGVNNDFINEHYNAQALPHADLLLGYQRANEEVIEGTEQVDDSVNGSSQMNDIPGQQLRAGAELGSDTAIPLEMFANNSSIEVQNGNDRVNDKDRSENEEHVETNEHPEFLPTEATSSGTGMVPEITVDHSFLEDTLPYSDDSDPSEMIDPAHENSSDVDNTLRNNREDTAGNLPRRNGPLPENGEPYSSVDENAQVIRYFSRTVLENQGKHFPQQNQQKRLRTETDDLEQDVLGEIKRPKNSPMETITVDPEVPAKEVEEMERQCANDQRSIDAGIQNTSHPDRTSPGVSLPGYNKHEKNPGSIPGTSTGEPVPLKKKQSRDRQGRKPFKWEGNNLLLLKAVEEQLISQGSEISEKKLLEDARKCLGNEFPKEQQLRSQLNNLLGFCLMNFMKKTDDEYKNKLKLIKKNLLRCIPVIRDILQKTKEPSALNALLEEIQRENEAKNK